MEISKRNNSIDLLRIILTFFVCLCHVLGHGGVRDAGSNSAIYYYVFWLLETIAICAVDGYGLISGYMSKSEKINTKRIILIYFETLFYSLIVTIVLNSIFYQNKLNIVELCFPVINRCFWYITAYIPLALLMPYINSFTENINSKKAKELLILIFVIFSITTIINDNYSDYGYSFVWLLVLYVIGRLMRKTNIFGKIKTLNLVTFYIFCVLLSFGILIFTGNSLILRYTSPTILLSAIILVVLFSRINLNSKNVSNISKCCLGIYLFQCSPIVWSLIDNKFISVVTLIIGCNFNYFIGTLSVFVYSLVLFVFGMLVDSIRSVIFNILKLNHLAEYLEKHIDNLMNHISD